MSTYSNRTTDGSRADRERMLSMIAGGLGALMFVWGFLRWFNIGEEPDQAKYSGYAFQMPTTAVIGFGVAAGLTAFLGATERRPGRGVPSAIPTALAGTSLLLAIGIWIGKDAISPDDGIAVGTEIGMILGVITAALQTIVLAMGLASRQDVGTFDDDRPRQRT